MRARRARESARAASVDAGRCGGDNARTMPEAEAFRALFAGVDQLAPGTPEITRRIGKLCKLDKESVVLDLGCGAGRSSLLWAEEFRSRVFAVDVDSDCVGRLQEAARKRGLEDRIHTAIEEMQTYHYQDEEVDAVLSEGSIYLMGFENAARHYRQDLRWGGHFAATHLTYVGDVRPEVRAFWDAEGGPYCTMEENLSLLRQAKYWPVHHEVLPEEAWRAYYAPIVARIPALRERFAGDAEGLGALDRFAREASLQLDGGGWKEAAYVLYVARKM